MEESVEFSAHRGPSRMEEVQRDVSVLLQKRWNSASCEQPSGEAGARLYMGVVVQALKDATCANPSTSEGDAVRPKPRDISEARDWLLSGSQDFRTVCGWAGLDPDYVMAKVRGLADAGWQCPDV